MFSWEDISFVLIGDAFHTPTYEEAEVLENIAIVVDKNGYIVDVFSPSDDEYDSCICTAKEKGICTKLKEGQYVLPGFIDTHIHAPQWPQSGKALDKDLPTWLMGYTFPLEASYRDMSFTKQVYNHLVDTLLNEGTTTAQYFGTADYDPNIELAKICLNKKQRAFIGKVVMDEPSQCPAFYRDSSTELALEKTTQFIHEIQSMAETQKIKITPVVTPRFIPSCTDKALYGLSDIALKYDVPIQSHCSEGDWEHAFVKERTGKRDTVALQEYGLLTERTTLAHCVFLNDDDAQIFKETGANISHCPVSNVLFAGAVAPIRKRLEQGVKVSLATDISGGYSPSMFDAMRQAILSSRQLATGVNHSIHSTQRGVPHNALTFKEAFYMATKGGADALGIKTGLFKKGYAFDALVFDAKVEYSRLFIYEKDTWEDILQKIVFLGQGINIIHVWVQGELIK